MAEFVDIMGVRFQVLDVESVYMAEGAKGYSDHDHATITILNDINPGIRRQVLIHEILHCIAGSIDIGLSEQKVQAIAAGLASIPQLRLEPGRKP